jgi:uncharacterized protein (DUF1810 family)
VPSSDPYDLDRFVRAQAPDYDRALSELREGRKRSHWMWYIFPQIEGLGLSPMSRQYAIRSAAEARHISIILFWVRDCKSAPRLSTASPGALRSVSLEHRTT